jgi:hypothetical protein
MNMCGTVEMAIHHAKHFTGWAIFRDLEFWLEHVHVQCDRTLRLTGYGVGRRQ